MIGRRDTLCDDHTAPKVDGCLVEVQDEGIRQFPKLKIGVSAVFRSIRESLESESFCHVNWNIEEDDTALGLLIERLFEVRDEHAHDSIDVMMNGVDPLNKVVVHVLNILPDPTEEIAVRVSVGPCYPTTR